jgi:predicted GNAT superfamily acetyltransferase
MEVSLADEEDIDGVLAVQKEQLLAYRPEESKTILEQEGFLIYPTSAEELRAIIQDKKGHIFLVAKEKEAIVGYVLTYDLETWIRSEAHWTEKIIVPEDVRALLYRSKTLYLRHVARRKGFKGCGKILETELFRLAKARGYSLVVAEILEKPHHNIASTSLHVKLGFSKIGIKNDKGGRVWGVYAKKL